MSDGLATVGEYVEAVSHDGIRVTTNRMTSEQLQESQDAEGRAKLETPEAKAKASEAGARLAERAKVAKAKPIPPEPKPEEAPKPEEKAAAPEAEVEADDEPVDESTDPSKEKPRHNAKARMLEATRQAAELKRQLREREAELQRLRSERANPPAPQRATWHTESGTYSDRADAEPDPSKYTDSPEDTLRFVADTAKWQARQELRAAREAEALQAKEREKSEAEAKTYVELDTRAESFRDRMAKVRETDPAFIDDVRAVTDLLEPTWRKDESGRWSPAKNVGPLNLLADEIVFRSEDPVPLLRYLAGNPAEIQRIAALKTPREFHREMASLEQRAAAATVVPPAPSVTTSKAKPPVSPVKTTPQGSDPDEITGKESVAEYVRKMNAREDRERRRRMQV